MSIDISPYSKELWPPIEVMVLAGWQKIKYVIIKLKVDRISQLPNIIEKIAAESTAQFVWVLMSKCFLYQELSRLHI